MESTGFYWKNLYVLLQEYGFEVLLVNPGFAKNVRGRKTDRIDAHWLRKMHSCGLLPGSFQPPDVFTDRLRSLSRHRSSLINQSADCVNKLGKCLVLMNLQLGNVIRDIVGKSGRLIIEAILAGERDAKVLAALCDKRIKASPELVTKSLEGIWRPEVLFELKQHYEHYQFLRQKIGECDSQIEQLLQAETQDRNQDPEQSLADYQPEYKKPSRQKNDPGFDILKFSYQLQGVDLFEIEGVGVNTILTLLAETGTDLKASFPSAKQFTSWLNLAPNRKVSGGKVLSARAPKRKHPLKTALRNAAAAVGRSKKQTALVAFFRRIQAKKGTQVAITATARKMATIIYYMLTEGLPYSPPDQKQYLEELRQHKISILNRWIRQLQIQPQELKIAPA